VTDQLWLETYRGSVFAWEVDHVGHFTVAYWLDRIEDAGLAMLAALGGDACVTTDCYVRYLQELRAGDVLHVVSGVLEAGASSLRLGHRVVNSATGAVCGAVEQTVAARAPFDATTRAATAAHRITWDGPPRERRPRPRGTAGFVDGVRDTVKPREMAITGGAALEHYVHRFSASGGHLLAAFGMTPAYMRDQRRGLSTFEFQLGFTGSLRPGLVVQVQSALLHVGNSSLHLFHRMLDAGTGAELATLHQLGVHLDMEARRPAPLPPALRDAARGLLVPAGD
jgi:acyl-CoA thioester hydrolase